MKGVCAFNRMRLKCTNICDKLWLSVLQLGSIVHSDTSILECENPFLVYNCLSGVQCAVSLCLRSISD